MPDPADPAPTWPGQSGRRIRSARSRNRSGYSKNYSGFKNANMLMICKGVRSISPE